MPSPRGDNTILLQCMINVLYIYIGYGVYFFSDRCSMSLRDESILTNVGRWWLEVYVSDESMREGLWVFIQVLDEKDAGR